MNDAENQHARARRIRQWMQDYGSMLQRICFVYLSDASLAEDAVQETFLKAWKSMEHFEGRNGSSVKTWLTRIAINTCKDYHRSNWWKNRYAASSLEAISEKVAGIEPEDRNMFMDILRLPKKYKEVILLYYYQQMTQREIAETLGISRTLVSHRLHKALKMLKIAWGEEGMK